MYSGTHSEVASYEFTTLTTVPGTLTHNGARIQVLDLPGIIEGAKDGKGRGRQVIAVARTCNLIFIVLDVLKPLNDLAILTNELEGFGIRLNKKPPNITIKKKESGGVSYSLYTSDSAHYPRLQSQTLFLSQNLTPMRCEQCYRSIE